jgi:hypothetical protein
MSGMADLTPSDLRRTVRHLIWKHDRMHQAARWLLLICCLQAAVIVWLVLS